MEIKLHEGRERMSPGTWYLHTQREKERERGGGERERERAGRGREKEAKIGVVEDGETSVCDQSSPPSLRPLPSVTLCPACWLCTVHSAIRDALSRLLIVYSTVCYPWRSVLAVDFLLLQYILLSVTLCPARWLCTVHSAIHDVLSRRLITFCHPWHSVPPDDYVQYTFCYPWRSVLQLIVYILLTKSWIKKREKMKYRNGVYDPKRNT